MNQSAPASGLTVGGVPSLPVKSLAEFVARAKKEDTTFSSSGNGSPGHIAAEVFVDANRARITHVPYKGNAPAVTALLSNEVQAGILATPGLLPPIQAGKVRPLAVTGCQRSVA